MSSMSLNTEVGAFVIFTGVGGYDGENEQARERLSVGELYEVLGMDVGAWSSTVTLREGSFNTVMFVNATPAPEEMPDDCRKSYVGK